MTKQREYIGEQHQIKLRNLLVSTAYYITLFIFIQRCFKLLGNVLFAPGCLVGSVLLIFLVFCAVLCFLFCFSSFCIPCPVLPVSLFVHPWLLSQLSLAFILNIS